MSLWDWRELNRLFESTDEPDMQIEGVSIDSRSLVRGDLFVALCGDPGERSKSSYTGARDGHDFAANAEQAGAVALLIHRDVDVKMPKLLAKDTLDGLMLLGETARTRTGARIVAITGSSGKTTCRNMVEQMLASSGCTHASLESLNNHWGVPLSLARMPRNSEFGVFEIGMNHPGEIAPLSILVRPDVAVVLNVLPAHIGHFGSLAEIHKEKLSIAAGLSEDGVMIVEESLDVSSVKHQILRFGFEAGNEIRCVNYSPGEHCRVDAVVAGNEVSYELLEGGKHRVQTSLAALAAVHALGANIETAVQILEHLAVPRGRGNRTTVNGITLVDDSYNANPVSLEHALIHLVEGHAVRRIVILGDMLELGTNSRQLHEGLLWACEKIDKIICVGEQMKFLYQRLRSDQQLASFAAANEIDFGWLVGNLRDGDVVLVKGSKKIFWQDGFTGRLIDALC